MDGMEATTRRTLRMSGILYHFHQDFTGFPTAAGVTEQSWFLKPENLNVFLFPGVLQLKSVKPGHAVIKGQSSSLFLCMDSGGHLRGQSVYEEADCSFRELLLADGYTRFLNSHHGIPISLASRNSQDQHSVPFTRFLPLRNMLPVEGISEDPVNHQRGINVESDDLFGMGLNTVVSPQLLMEK
ncbi:fibroblast growth factor 21 [Nothobranchius furzeri]|uniref:Fibroblast growth factor n=1 Tax=Nothobranchius furzeri TaxID=105023 RepID=A0A9D2XLG0_NOTFU|nr:fibroblast growth factor 21 [Nothobranchius furzeri]